MRLEKLVPVALMLGTFAQGAVAEDIDLFLGNNQAVSSANPNVLIIIDNAASNNASIANPCGPTQKKFEMEICTIANLINSSAVGPGVNLGLAAFSPSNSPRGGYIRYAVRPMTTANKSGLISKLNSLTTNNNAPYALSMHEAYLYYAGLSPYAGLASGATDPAAYSAATNTYISPAEDSCQRNYIIFIGNGGPDSGENSSAQTKLNELGGVLSDDPIKLSPNNYQSNWADEYARFLYRKDFSPLEGAQNIVTYTIAVYNPSAPSDNTTPALAARALLQSMAKQGGGKYFAATDSASLVQALKDILIEIQAVNSVFAAVTLPVSVNVRGTYLNQVYMGVFRPDENAFPRWVGNLKQYQLLPDSATGELYLADAEGRGATNNVTGFVNPNAVSYWTQDSNFWSFDPSGVGAASDRPDGDIVEKGATAQWQRTAFAASQAARKLYTCTTGCTVGSPLSSTPFDLGNTSITQAATGTTSAADRDNLIRWVRGQDLQDENSNNSTTDVRASIHGDVLHSRPAVVNYNRFGDDDDIIVFYGANDGIFRAIQGGRLTSGTRAGGTELWGFIPSEFFGRLKRLRDNDTNILAPNPGKPYFVDGAIGVYQHDANSDGKLVAADGDVVRLYIAMRRGGRFLYALDVSNPDNPRFLWKRANTDSGYAELGQTWSTPVPARVRAFGGPVLIMGAGYDPAAEDAEPQGAASMGRGIMVIDANNGQLLWQAGPSPTGASYNHSVPAMTRSVAAEIAVLDRDFDGYADRLYAVDTGANIWRVDIDDPDPSRWTVTRLAALGGSGANARKFLFGVDVVYGDSSPGSTQPFDAVLVGSGDREHPFDTTVANRFYMIKDPNMGKGVQAGFQTIVEGDLYDATDNLVQDGTSEQQNDARGQLEIAKGWYVRLGSGEKVVGNAVTMGGTVFFGTHQPTPPSPGVCTNLGTARFYALDFLTAASTIDSDDISGLSVSDRSVRIPGGGFLPSPVPVVTIIDGKPYQAVIPGTHVQTPPTKKLGVRYRTYWHNRLDH